MATMTKSEIADLVLESLGVKAFGQNATTEDSTLVQKAIDTAHDQLRKRRVAPYELSAVPEWAQIPLRDYVSADLVTVYGISGERMQLLLSSKLRALSEMAMQAAPKVMLPHARPDYF
jgi:hypothetical protein